MKRSEMLKIIKNECSNGPTQKPSEMALDILNAIERAGMVLKRGYDLSEYGPNSISFMSSQGYNVEGYPLGTPVNARYGYANET